MEGNIDFYKHAGIDLASKMKIHYHAEPRESEVPYFLAQELIPGYWGNREGTYCPPKGYFVADDNPDAFEVYEATFPKKKKSFQEGQLPQFCQSCGMPLHVLKIVVQMPMAAQTMTTANIAIRMVTSCKTVRWTR